MLGSSLGSTRCVSRHGLAAVALAVCAVTAAPSTARADDTSSGRTPASVVQIELAPHVVALGHAQSIGAGLGAGALVRVADAWSIGAYGAIAMLPYSEDTSALIGPTGGEVSYGTPPIDGLRRGDVEVRYHAYRSRWIGVYGGPTLGVSSVSFAHTSAHLGPRLGAALGFDFYPARVLAIGVAARGGGAWISPPDDGGRALGDASFGLVLGIHLPSSPPPTQMARAD